ncbi:hypothetical protein V6Z12_A12G176600 [Gossypium hirsutum]
MIEAASMLLLLLQPLILGRGKGTDFGKKKGGKKKRFWDFGGERRTDLGKKF